MVFASQFQYVTSHNGNLAIIFSYMSFSLQQYISLLYGEFSRRRKNLDFLSFGSLVGIRRIFWNAAYDGGWQGSFCACSNLASSRYELLKYLFKNLEMQLMVVVDRKSFCACSNLASSRSERLKYGSHVWSSAPLQRVKVQTPLLLFLIFYFQKKLKDFFMS